MRTPIAWFVKNPVASNLLMWIFLVGGVVAYFSLNQEEFPDIEVGVIQLSVPYLGATPEESETGVCLRIEEALEGTDGLTPSKTVELLDRFIVGQSDAKRACAVALRNRWRRHRVDPSLRDEIVPKNILMIGESHLHFISVRVT